MNNKAVLSLKNYKDTIISKNEINNYLKKLIDILIATYEKDPSNEINLINMETFLKSMNIDNNGLGEKDSVILDQLNFLEKKVLDYINIKFDLKLTGKEIKIDLNGKNIGNIDLELISGIEFKNLEDLNISNNNISNIETLKTMKAPNLKKIDISGNPIENIDDIQMKANIEEINLKNTNIMKKDIQDLKNIIIHGIDLKNNKEKECILKYEINNINNIKKKLKEKDKNIRDLLNDMEELEKKLLGSLIIFPIDKNLDINLDNDNVIGMGFEEIKNICESKEVHEKNILLSKLENFKKRMLSYTQIKLNIKIEDNNLKLNLNGENIDNIFLDFIGGVDYKNLEELDLSNNNISDIKPLENFKNLKKIDLSFNKISNIEPLANLIKPKIKKIDLSFNEIINIQPIFKENLKDSSNNYINYSGIFEQIKNVKMKINGALKDETIELNSNNKIRIFGECFVKNNKNNCSIYINNKKKELCEFYEYSINENNIIVKLIMNEKVNNFSEMFKDCSSLISFNESKSWNTMDTIDMSYMFCNCLALSSISDISKWDTSNVTNMSYLFYNCSSLIPFPDISKWNISKTKNKNDMLYGCLNINNNILNKFK